MTAPTVMPSKKAAITPRAALISTLRTWLLYRDRALWAFTSGTEADDPLEKIDINDETLQHISDANDARDRALALAQAIAEESEQKTATVMREAVTELLASESPQFLLSLPHIPGSF